MITVQGLRRDARMAGRVLRYHTWPHIRPQTVGEHSWQVARILLSIHPLASRDLLVHTVVHDMGELRTGDLPYPVKADNPPLQAIMDDLEYDAMAEICSNWEIQAPMIGELDRWAFKLAEFIEMAEWGMEEALMGNQFARLVADRCLVVCWDRIGKGRDDFDKRPIAMAARKYLGTRLKEWSYEPRSAAA